MIQLVTAHLLSSCETRQHPGKASPSPSPAGASLRSTLLCHPRPTMPLHSESAFPHFISAWNGS